MTALESLAGLAQLAESPDHNVPSPCISVCRMDENSGLCQGCFRTIEEVIAWGRAGEQDKRRIWRLIVQRAGLGPANSP